MKTCEHCAAPLEGRSKRFCTLACFQLSRVRLHICEKCGKSFKPKSGGPGRFCSNACRRVDSPPRPCAGCGKVYMPHRSTRGVYCSRACIKRRVVHTCVVCGGSFEAKLQRTNPLYCSADCHFAIGRRTFACVVCGKERTVKKSSDQRYCSRACTSADLAEGILGGGFAKHKRETGHRTDIEALTEVALKRLGLVYLFEHQVGPYWIDFALPDLGVALECDGWAHFVHANPEREKRRDDFLRGAGWDVVRLPDAAIYADAHREVEDILLPWIQLDL